MSGAAAVASARRRRAVPQQSILPAPVSTRANSNSYNVDPNSNPNPNPTYTPLQVLQIHGAKIKEIDDTLEERVKNYLDEYFKENPMSFAIPANNPVSIIKSEDDESLQFVLEELKKRLDSLETNHKSLSVIQGQYQHQNIDKNTIIAELNTRVDQILSIKTATINETIKSISVNIEKMSDVTKINELYTTRIDNLIDELNIIKTLMIKTQSLNLETNSEVLKIKNEIERLNKSHNVCQSSLEELQNTMQANTLTSSSCHIPLPSMQQNTFGVDNMASLFLKSMMVRNMNYECENSENSENDQNDAFSKINIHEQCVETDTDAVVDIDIDVDIDNINELKLSDEDIQDIKEEIIDIVEESKMQLTEDITIDANKEERRFEEM